MSPNRDRKRTMGAPTDDDLLQALEEYERQEQEEARLAALGEDAAGEGADTGERGEPTELEEHRRRRQQAAFFDSRGNPEP